MIKKLLIICFLLGIFDKICFGNSKNSSEEVFTNIYEKGIWGGKWFSGGGSKVEGSAPYMKLLQEFLKKYEIKTVVDIGCGDWLFSRHMDWTGIQYTGYDVVDHIIEVNQKQFASNNIVFKKADCLSDYIQGGDLLLCKEVLQHLTNDDVHYFIKNIIPKFHYCLIVNQIDRITKSSDNPDQARGGTRPIDLTKAPFSVKGKVVLIYESEPGVFKQVVCVVNDKK